MARRAQIEVDDARRLPHLRARPSLAPIVERYRMEREQARVLLEALEENPERSLRHTLTKPGDAAALRGLPAIARGVSGVQPGTDPVAALLRKEDRRERSGL